MSGDAEFPKSPIRGYDPFGKESGVNPFAEPVIAQTAETPAQEDGNVYHASAALAEHAPEVEYEAILEPRILVISTTFTLGLCLAAVATILLITYPLPPQERGFYALLFPVVFAFFFGAALISRFDLRAMRQGAMKRDHEQIIRRTGLFAWLGVAFSLILEAFCLWPIIEHFALKALGR